MSSNAVELAFEGMDNSRVDNLGRSVQQDVRRLIEWYGEETVKAELACQTAPMRGRPSEKDWQILAPYLQDDIREWLSGADPFSTRADHAIALAFSAEHPGHNQISTHRRIARKLKSGRRLWVLHMAWARGRSSAPHAVFLRTLLELAKDPNSGMTSRDHELALETIRDHERKIGAPDASASFAEIEDAVRKCIVQREPGQ